MNEIRGFEVIFLKCYELFSNYAEHFSIMSKYETIKKMYEDGSYGDVCAQNMANALKCA